MSSEKGALLFIGLAHIRDFDIDLPIAAEPSPKELSYGPRCEAGSSFMGGLISQSKTWFLPEVWGVFMWVLGYVTLFRQHIFVLL